MMNDLYLNISLNSSTLDRYFVRTSIVRAIEEQSQKFNGNLLDAGCGKMPYKEWILKNSKTTNYVGLDIETALDYDKNVKPDYTWNGIKMPFEDNTFDTVMATEVLEHCPEPLVFLKEAHRVLKPNGIFFFTVPFLWVLHETPHDEHRYTPFALERMFKAAGFQNIEIKALGGFNASLATMLGLWINRHCKNSFFTKILRRLLTPVIKRLIKKDVPPTAFKENTMATGFYGTIKK